MPGLRYVERPPGTVLAPYLECVWEVSDPRPRSDRPVERVVPDGCPELIVHLEDRFARRVGGRWRVQPRLFLAGTLTRPWLLRAGPRVRTLGMRFRPGAPRAFFDLAMAAATDREEPLSTLVGAASVGALMRGLRSARTNDRRFAADERWLAARLDSRRLERLSAAPAVGLMVAARGTAPVEKVARTLGWSRRRVERAFRRDLGIRPKLFARILRLNAVLATLDEADRARAVRSRPGRRLLRPGPPASRLPRPGWPRAARGTRRRRRDGAALHPPGAPPRALPRRVGRRICPIARTGEDGKLAPASGWPSIGGSTW